MNERVSWRRSRQKVRLPGELTGPTERQVRMIRGALENGESFVELCADWGFDDAIVRKRLGMTAKQIKEMCGI